TARAATHVGMGLITLATITCASVLFPSLQAWAVPVGGWLGASVAGSIVGVIGRAGAVLVLVASALIGAILVTRASLVEVTSNAVQRVQDTGDKLRINDGVRAVGGGFTHAVRGVFTRRTPKEAPPLLDDVPIETMDGDIAAASAHVPQEAAAPESALPPIQADVDDAALPPVQADADDAHEIPVHVQSLERPDASPAVSVPPAASAEENAPVIRPRAHAPMPAPPAPAAPPAQRSAENAAVSRDASSVAARARRAIEAFRRSDAQSDAAPAPSPEAPPIAPAVAPVSAVSSAAPTTFSPPTAE